MQYKEGRESKFPIQEAEAAVDVVFSGIEH